MYKKKRATIRNKKNFYKLTNKKTYSCEFYFDIALIRETEADIDCLLAPGMAQISFTSHNAT